MTRTTFRYRSAFAGLLSCLLAAGCARVERASPPQPPRSEATQAGPVPAEPPPASPTQTAAVAVVAPAGVATRGEAAPVEPASAARPAAKPPAKNPAKVPASPVPAQPLPTKESAAPVAAHAPPPSAPPLDLKTLETRLRETSAIGVFTKIALKNQVDDLLDKFRAYYKGRVKTTLAELRQPFDLLLFKVLSLLQDSDPPLAHDIVASREAIWGILADQGKFTESNLMAGETP